MFKGQEANLDSAFPVHLLSWAWREHQVITWTRRPWAQLRKATFITDQLQLSDVPGEEELLVSIAKCWRMKTGEMEGIKIHKRYPGLNLHRGFEVWLQTPLLQVHGSFYSRAPHLRHFRVIGSGLWVLQSGYSLHQLWGRRRLWWAEPSTDDLLDRGEDDRSYEWGSRPRDKWASLWAPKMVSDDDV